MDSFGRILRETREEKNLTVEAVAKETAISMQYINALENERVEVFPGEPYAIGFLRNYAEYLGLDSANIIALLRAKKIQESPVPIELYKPHRPKYLIPLIISVALILILGIGALLWFILGPAKTDEQHSTAVTNITGNATYKLAPGESLAKRVYQGDIILVPRPGGDISLTVKKTQASLDLSTPAGDMSVELGEEVELDIDGKPGGEIIVFLSDISKSDPTRGAEVRIVLKSEAAASASPVPAVAPIAPEANLGRSVVILEDTRAYPFVINATFRSACLFRYQTDRGERRQNYYTGGQILTMQANNAIRLWIANDTAVKLQLSADGKNYDLDMAWLGRLPVCDVRWTRDNTNTYRLVVTELD
ncbi:MAG: helix-turn-helix domain-containing protein [Spirochaetaceae bacterium]|jgi:cytoskeletal protein RodZ|nr:helix-turn-helix domain-containing protein [Spirochaetaceae bacterium]